MKQHRSGRLFERLHRLWPWCRKPKRTILPQSAKTHDVPKSATKALSAKDRPEQQKIVVENQPNEQRVYQDISKPKNPRFEYWDFPNEAAVREPPPASISKKERLRFQKLLQFGSDSSTTGGEDMTIILGLDFGTSSTKVIVRMPYEAGEPTIAIPAPYPCRSGDHPYLWQTVLWLKDEDTFLPWPEPGARILNSLKQGLIQGRNETKIRRGRATVEVTAQVAAVAYLSFAIRYVRGWLLHNRPNLFRKRKPVWLVNLGMPAASYDDPKLVKPYRCIGAAALQLAKIADPITVKASQRFLDDRYVAEAGKSEENAKRLGIAVGVAVVPEAAAEMTSFAKSTRNAPGLYLLVDVGAMTLDVCMFRLKQEANPSDLYAFMAAQIRPLGVDSFHWFRSEGKTECGFVEQCNRTLRAVIWNTKKHRDPRASSWTKGNDVPVFLTGGGSKNGLHRKVVESLDKWLKEQTHNDGIRLLDLPKPSTIELPEKIQDFRRMAVAYGLSHLREDIGEIRPMSDIEDILPRSVVDTSDRFTSKDQV